MANTIYERVAQIKSHPTRIQPIYVCFLLLNLGEPMPGSPEWRNNIEYTMFVSSYARAYNLEHGLNWLDADVKRTDTIHDRIKRDAFEALKEAEIIDFENEIV